jgi:hypothetical protein
MFEFENAQTVCIASICGLGFWKIHWQVFINKRLSDKISTVEF